MLSSSLATDTSTSAINDVKIENDSFDTDSYGDFYELKRENKLFEERNKRKNNSTKSNRSPTRLNNYNNEQISSKQNLQNYYVNSKKLPNYSTLKHSSRSSTLQQLESSLNEQSIKQANKIPRDYLYNIGIKSHRKYSHKNIANKSSSKKRLKNSNSNSNNKEVYVSKKVKNKFSSNPILNNVESVSDLSSSTNFILSEFDTDSNFSIQNSKFQRKKFIKCVLREDMNLLRALLSQNNLINIRDKHLNTLLHIACGFGRLKSVQALMKMCPALIDQLDDKGHGPLDIAIKHGQLEVVKWLLFKTNRLATDSNNGKNYLFNKNRRSCLHLAAKHGENEILKYILTEMYRKQMSLDIKDVNGNTAAHLAAKYNNLDCLQTLVEFNCDITIVNKNGHTPCFVAEFYGNQECVHYLMIVETCINLSIKVVRMSKRLRETRTSNEILKAQMEEAIAINNDFINQRENVMNISLELMKRQIVEMENKLLKEIDRVQIENRNLQEIIRNLNEANYSNRATNTKSTSYNQQPNENMLKRGESPSRKSANRISLSPIPPNSETTNKTSTKSNINYLENELKNCKKELASTEQNCNKILKIDQNRLDNIRKIFNEVMISMETSENNFNNNNGRSSSFDLNNNEILDKNEHFEELRKMYQLSTHKLMIFRNALKERQSLKNANSSSLGFINSNSINTFNRTATSSALKYTPSQSSTQTVSGSIQNNNTFQPIDPSLANNLVQPLLSHTRNTRNTSQSNLSPTDGKNRANIIQLSQQIQALNNQMSNNFNLNELELIVEEDVEPLTKEEILNINHKNKQNINENQNQNKINYNSDNRSNATTSSNSSSSTSQSIDKRSLSSYNPMVRPIQSSTPTLSMHPTDFNEKNNLNSNQVNNNNSKMGPQSTNKLNVDMGNNLRDESNLIYAQQQNDDNFDAHNNANYMENLLYSSDETLSDNDYDLEQDLDEDDEDDDDELMEEDEEIEQNLNEGEEQNEQEEYVDDQDEFVYEDEDLDDYDRKCLNYDDRNDSNSVSTNNREIYIEKENISNESTNNLNGTRPTNDYYYEENLSKEDRPKRSDQRNYEKKSQINQDQQQFTNIAHKPPINGFSNRNQVKISNQLTGSKFSNSISLKKESKNFYSTANFNRQVQRRTNNTNNEIIIEEIEEINEEFNYVDNDEFPTEFNSQNLQQQQQQQNLDNQPQQKTDLTNNNNSNNINSRSNKDNSYKIENIEDQFSDENENNNRNNFNFRRELNSKLSLKNSSSNRPKSTIN